MSARWSVPRSNRRANSSRTFGRRVNAWVSTATTVTLEHDRAERERPEPEWFESRGRPEDVAGHVGCRPVRGRQPGEGCRRVGEEVEHLAGLFDAGCDRRTREFGEVRRQDVGTEEIVALPREGSGGL